MTDDRITLRDLFAAAALASGKHHSDDGIVDRAGCEACYQNAEYMLRFRTELGSSDWPNPVLDLLQAAPPSSAAQQDEPEPLPTPEWQELINREVSKMDADAPLPEGVVGTPNAVPTEGKN